MNLLPRVLGGAALAAVLGIGMAASPASAAEGTVLGAGRSDAVAGQYIVVLKSGMAATSMSGFAGRYGGKVGHTYSHALNGFSATMSERAARQLAADPAVASVVQDSVVTIADTQTNPPSWGLDRIDQRNLPLNQSYTYPTTATNVTAYIIDTGVRFTHQTFGGRAVSGRDTVDNDNNATDCNGHGTHVAGTVGGSQYGVAKGVRIVGVRVLNCQGSGTNAQVVAGIDWAAGDHTTGNAVANMSLGGGANTATDTAVTNAVADGISFAVAAGNESTDACTRSPARTPNAITVGATGGTSGSSDTRAGFSNFGTCLDIFGPGVAITSSWMTSDTATNTISGTSMATPHVAGVAAIIKSQNPSFTPQQVRDRMVADSTPNVVGNPGTNSPNRLLFVNNGVVQPPGQTVFFDNFETALGWTTNPNGTDTAATGAWERGDPQATSSGGVALQNGTTVSGTNDLVTGAAAGTSAGTFDVDAGTTSSQSPAITLPGTGTLTLTFSWYLAHLTNATNADFFRVSVVSGASTTVVFQQLGAGVNRTGTFATATVNLTSFAGQTIRLRVEAADAATASLIEAGVDDVRITQN